jgi:hypothetical protein
MDLNEKKPRHFCRGFFIDQPANELDGLNTATFLAMGYRANTKSFSPHLRTLLST